MRLAASRNSDFRSSAGGGPAGAGIDFSAVVVSRKRCSAASAAFWSSTAPERTATIARIRASSSCTCTST